MITAFIILIVSNLILPYSNFMYDQDDWFTIKSLGQIQSFTETNHNEILIGTTNGIFTYDKLTDELFYDMYLTRDLPSLEIKNIFYDKNTDHVWVYHSDGVSLKAFSSFSYHHLSKSTLIDRGLSKIDDIGSSDHHIWFRRGDNIVAANPFSGKFIPNSKVKDSINSIIWGSSIFGYSGENINLSEFYISDTDWSIGYRLNNISNKYIDYNVFFDSNGNQVIPTVKFIDSDNNTWIGTDMGFIFSAWGRSRKLEHIESGLQGQIISDIYIDKQNNWWFYDSQFKRSYILNDLRIYDKSNNFLTFWNETQGKWKNYKTNESIAIQSNDINDMIEYDGSFLMATSAGLTKFDGEWELMDVGDGLSDNFILEIESSSNRVFTLSKSGLNEIHVNSFSVLPTKFKPFSNLEIYDMVVIEEDPIYLCSNSYYSNQQSCINECKYTEGTIQNCEKVEINEMFLSTNNGLYTFNLISDNINYLHPKSCKQLEINDLELFCLDDGIWKINILSPQSGFKKVIQNKNIRNFTLSDNFIWTNLFDRVRLTDLETGETWYYNDNDGILGKNIYKVGNNKDWVWFLSTDGVSLYNWRKYHDN